MSHLALLCGMFTAHRTDENSDENLENTVSRYGVGVMLRAQEIRGALMVDDLRTDRQRRDAEIQAMKSGSAASEQT
jgi:hypothetical protein